MGSEEPGSSHDHSPAHRCDEFQPGNPRRVALQQSSPPLPRPTSCCNPQLPFVETYLSERHTGTSQTVSLQGVTPKGCQDFTLCRRSRPVAEHFNRGDDLYKSRLEGANRFLGK